MPVNRRAFFTTLGSSLLALPMVLHAKQPSQPTTCLFAGLIGLGSDVWPPLPTRTPAVQTELDGLALDMRNKLEQFTCDHAWEYWPTSRAQDKQLVPGFARLIRAGWGRTGDHGYPHSPDGTAPVWFQRDAGLYEAAFTVAFTVEPELPARHRRLYPRAIASQIRHSAALLMQDAQRGVVDAR